MKRLLAWLLAGEENREALLGDFVEAGLGEREKVKAALELVLRRQWEAWRRPGPWVVLLFLLPIYVHLSAAVTSGVQILATPTPAASWLRIGGLACLLGALYSGVAGIVNARLAGGAGRLTRWLLPATALALMPVFNFAIADAGRLLITYFLQIVAVVGFHEIGWRKGQAGGASERWRSLGAAALAIWMTALLVGRDWPRGWEAALGVAVYWPFLFWVVNSWNKKRRSVLE